MNRCKAWSGPRTGLSWEGRGQKGALLSLFFVCHRPEAHWSLVFKSGHVISLLGSLWPA